MKRAVRLILAAAFVLLLFATTTDAQPMALKAVPDNSTNFVEVGDLVYFTSGNSLWRTDGTETGTFQLANGFLTTPFSFRQFNDYALFLVGASLTRNEPPTQLWRTDGTPGGTVLLMSKDFIQLQSGTSNYFFFSGTDASSGRELYRTDGSTAGTILLKDIYPGAADGFRGYAQALNERLIFSANDGNSGTELWQSDGTPSGTVILKDINPGPGNGVDSATNAFVRTNTFVHNNRYYFKGIVPAYGGEPWVSDGTPGGTVMLADTEAGAASPEFVIYRIANNDAVYFTIETEDPYGYMERGDLWKTSGSPSTTSLVKTIGEPFSRTQIHSFRTYKGKVYFWSRIELTTDLLWVSDGTPAGTNDFFDLVTVDGGIMFFEATNDYLLFTAEAEGIPYNFYRSDGTREGTKVFAEFRSRNFLTYPRDLTKAGNLVFYGDHDGLTDQNSGQPYAEEDAFHLFEADGDTTRSMRTLWGVSTPQTDHITPLNERVVFTANHEGQKKLWVYDPAVRPEPEPTFTLVHAGSDKDVRRLTDDALIVNPWDEPLNIRFDPVESAGSVQFTLNGAVVRTETAPPYSLGGDVNGDYAPWEHVPGTYTLTATAYPQPGAQGTPGESLTVTFEIARDDDPGTEECTASGTILREFWDNVSGSTVPSIPVDTPPTSTSQLTIFEGPTNAGTNYGARIRGYICPPVTGSYTFWIASNDHSELWLSTDDNPANKRRIANLTSATAPREWNKFASQKSQPVHLESGHRYYIEALHKQGAGTDNVAVGWQLPDGTLERPIPGSRLSPAEPADNMNPVVEIMQPEDGQSFMAPADITITVNVSDEDGHISLVEFFEGSNKIGEDRNTPFSFDWRDVAAGTYTITARATDNEAATATSSPVTISVTGECMASGTITREYWDGVSGNEVSRIPVDSQPTSITELSIFEGPSNVGTNYGARIRGYICVPVTGQYTFWISSNDHSELWLSTDADPANKRRIAYLDRATGPREWNRFSTQRSAMISLTQGQTYYIEALHKQGIGSDHVAVGWQLPDGTLERPISGSRLSPFMSAENAAARVAEVSSTSQTDKMREQISIYPNPATADDRELTIAGYEGIDETIETRVEILNMTGEVVFADDVSCGGDCGSYRLKIDKKLLPGVYLVNIRTKDTRFTRRLLVK